MSILQLTITQAGRNALVNAQNTGTLPIIIDGVSFGAGLYVPSEAQTSLLQPVKTIATFGGSVVADDTIHITVTDESADAYSLGEIGLYAGGVLFGVYSQETRILEKGPSQLVLLSADIKFTSVAAGSVSVGDAQFAYPQATESRLGVAEIATAGEAQGGVDHDKIITPKTLRQEMLTRLGKEENAVSASKLATGRSIALAGGVSGSATFDGSANITITTVVADDSHAHVIGNIDGLQAELDGKLPAAGNAVSASKLANGRSIALAGDVSGSATFDGSSNITITAVVADDSHAHVIGNIDGLQAALDGKKAVAVLSGVIANGGTIPLPSGYTEAQCDWLVSMNDSNVNGSGWDVREGLSTNHYETRCYTTGRVVTATMYAYNDASDSGVTYAASANYIIIGVK